jgi:hypothetical protein
MFEEIVRRIPDLELAGEEMPPRRPSNFICGFEEMSVRLKGT